MIGRTTAPRFRRFAGDEPIEKCNTKDTKDAKQLKYVTRVRPFFVIFVTFVLNLLETFVEGAEQ